ncbi:BlaI/MecI/CopY family transcriptional regulator [bacterium]|nr:BlaI/MecI/CopY family transcriptional regulator [bacterium]
MADLQFGRVQMKIMRVLWEKKQATAREITDILNESEPIAHSTVQTLLRALEQKGAVGHDVEDRTFTFYPLVENENVMQNALSDFIDRVFAGSAGGMVSYLVNNRYISPEELKGIFHLFDKKKP